MRDQSEPFSPEAYLPAVTGYYSDVAGNMLSFPFNVSTPILYYNKICFAPRARSGGGAEDLGRGRRCGEAPARAGSPCGLTTSWPSWVHVENFSAFHNLPLATRANGFGGLDAELTFNNADVVRHIAQLAEWQATKVFDYSGRGQSAEPRFQKANVPSSSARRDARGHQGQFEVRVGYGMIRIAPKLPAPRKLHHRAPRYGCCATGRAPNMPGRAVLRLSLEAGSPGRLAPEHRLSADHPRRLRPHPRAGFLRSRSRCGDRYRAVDLEAADREFEGYPAWSFVLIRSVIDEELEQVFNAAARTGSLDVAVERGNRLLRQFERANPDR